MGRRQLVNALALRIARLAMSKRLVLLSIFAIFFGIIGYDIFLYADNIPGNSITQVVISTTHDYPILAWAIGFLMGYLTAHFYDPEEQQK